MLGEQVYDAPQLTLHMKTSVKVRPSNWHWKMNLQHAVQHSLNTSLARLHTTKPVGTGRLTPPRLIQHYPWPYDQNQEPKEHVYSHLWRKHSHHIQSVCAQTHFCCTNNRIIFMCMNKLYASYVFFPEKGSVRINSMVCGEFHGKEVGGV